jgi:hypothetical protein
MAANVAKLPELLRERNPGFWCPLLALSGHPKTLNQCPLSGVKRTLHGRAPMSAFDPKRTFNRPPEIFRNHPQLAAVIRNFVIICLGAVIFWSNPDVASQKDK